MSDCVVEVNSNYSEIQISQYSSFHSTLNKYNFIWFNRYIIINSNIWMNSAPFADCCFFSYKSIASNADLSSSISNFINNNPISINPTTSILDAMKIMEDRHSQISCLPVIDSDGKCLGLLTLHDLYQTKLV